MQQCCLKKIVIHKVVCYPVYCAEVNSLCEVKALIEPAVICSGEGDDKLTSTLVCAVNL